MTAPPSATDRAATKRFLRVGLIGPLLLAAAVVLLGSSAIMASIVRDDERNEIFTDAAELPPDLVDEVVWLPDPGGLPREMEPLTRDAVTASWIRAWEQLEIVASTGDTSGVEVYFANSAREGVLAQASQWSGRSVSQLGHDLQLTFYSEDGQIIGLSSVESRLQRSETRDEVEYTRGSRESYDAVLVLDDGNWRVHHWVRRSFDAG